MVGGGSWGTALAAHLAKGGHAVTLVVRGPGYDVGRDSAPVQHHDVARMILEAAGLPPLDGAERADDLQVAELSWYRGAAMGLQRVRHAFREGDHKLVVDSGGEVLAFDLARDPDERSPIRDAPWAPALRARGEAWLAARGAAAP